MTFLHEVAFVASMLVCYFVCGFVLVSPWISENRRFLVMFCPAAGLLLTSTLSLGLYVLCGIAMQVAIVTSFVLCAVGSTCVTWFLRPRFKARDVMLCVLSSIAVCLFVTLTCCYATISSGEPATLCLDGTDQLGYGHIADWLLNHKVADPPLDDSRFPYESWPSVLFAIDPRFATFSYMATISFWSHESGFFSYDRACAIALATAALAVPALFSSRASIYIALSISLLCSHWFDYSRDGFLAKVIAYPGFLSITGLFFLGASRKWKPTLVLAMAVLVVCVALCMSGVLAAIWLLISGCIFVVGQIVTKDKPLEEGVNNLIFLAVFCMISVVATGTLARPFAFGSVFTKDLPYGWNRVLCSNLELENHGILLLSGLSSEWTFIIFAVSILVLAVSLYLAVRTRCLESLALFSVMFVPIAIRLLNAKWLMYNLTGILYPFALCAIGAMIKPQSRRAMLMITFLLLSVLFFGRLPRVIGVVKRYGSMETPKLHQFTKSCVEQLALIADREQVLVDLPYPQHGLVLLVELLRDGHHLDWTPNAYRTVLGYRPWKSPPLRHTPTVKVVLPSAPNGSNPVEFQSEQFKVLRLRK